MNFKNIIITVVAFLIIFWACSPRDKASKKYLSVSINPQKYFLDHIVKDRYTVNTIIPNGSSPESFDPSPSQMVALGRSLIYFKIGLFDFENVRMSDILKKDPTFNIVDCSAHIDLENQDCSDHKTNPHIWSSPNTARAMAKNMYDAMVAEDSEHKLFYTLNFEDLLNEINQTDNIIKAYLAKASSRSFVIFHPALNYFADEYGLNQLSVEFEGKNPSPARLKEIIDTAKSEHVKVIFVQEEFDKKNAETIAHEIGAKVVPINLLSYDWSVEMIKVAKALANE